MLHLILIGVVALFLIGYSIETYIPLYKTNLGIEQTIVATSFGVGVFSALSTVVRLFGLKGLGIVNLDSTGIFFLGFLWLSMLNSITICYYIKKFHSLRDDFKKGNES